MSSATENYGRLKLLLERLVHPAAENVLETYLRSEKVAFHRFLDTHNITLCIVTVVRHLVVQLKLTAFIHVHSH